MHIVHSLICKGMAAHFHLASGKLLMSRKHKFLCDSAHQCRCCTSALSLLLLLPLWQQQ